MPRFLRYTLSFLLSVLLLVALLVAVGFAVLYQKQGQLVQEALEDYNQQIEGKILLEYSKVSPFANFPYISVDLHGLQAFEHKFDTIPLLRLEDVYVGFDLFELARGNVEIKKIKVMDGRLDLVLHTDTSYNFLNAVLIPSQNEPEKEPNPSSDFTFALDAVELKNITLHKFSELDSSAYAFQIKRIGASLAKTDTAIFAEVKGEGLLSVNQNNSAWAKDKPIAFQTRLDFEKAEQLLKISPSELYIQGVYFALEGSVDLDNDMELDLRIRGEKEDFSLFFAFLPPEFDEFASRYKNAGNIYFDASVQGKSANAHIPRIEARFGCQNGFFENANVSRRVDDLRFTGSFTNGKEGTLKSAEFRLLDFSAVPEQGIVEVDLVLRDFLDPYVDLKVHTDFDLQFLADFFQVNSIQGLKGKVLLDVNYDELVDINRPETVLEGVQQGIDSRLRITDLGFELPDYPFPIEDIDVLATMMNGRLELDTFQLRIGTSDMHISGFISDLPAILHAQKKEVEVGMQLRSDLIDLRALTSFDSARITPIDDQIQDLCTSFMFRGLAGNLTTFKYLPKGDFLLDDFYLRLQNYAHTFHDFNIQLSIAEEDMVLHQLHGEIDASDFDLSGQIFNYPKWMKDTTDGQSRVEFAFLSKHLHPADLLSYNGMQYLPAEYQEEDIREFSLKGSLDLNYDSGKLKAYDLMLDEAGGKFTLHPLKLEEVKGRIHGEDGRITTEDLRLRLGKSDLSLSMDYHYGSNQASIFRLQSSYFDFDELNNFKEIPKDSLQVHAEAFNVFELPFSNNLVALNIDKLNYHKVNISNLAGRFRMTEDHFLYVDQWDMDLADGHVSMQGYFNGSNPDSIYFSPDLIVQNVDLNKVLIKVDNFGQEYLVNDNIKGALSGKVSGTIRLYPDLFPILQESALEMDIMINNGVMVNYAPFQLLGDYFSDRNLNYVRFDTLQNTFTLRNNVLNIPAMTINSSLGFMEISGTQSLDMEMNYLLRIPWNVVTNAGVQKLFGRKNKEEVPLDQIDEIIARETGKRVRFLNVRLTGTPDDYQVSLGKGREGRSN
jgi:hypothetical protein